jgi:hypothetical protein
VKLSLWTRKEAKETEGKEGNQLIKKIIPVVESIVYIVSLHFRILILFVGHGV